VLAEDETLEFVTFDLIDGFVLSYKEMQKAVN